MTRDKMTGGRKMNLAKSNRSKKQNYSKFYRARLSKQDGSAMVIALLIMVLLMGFVALAISRTSSETISSANDAAETRAFAAAHASLEVMTRNFQKIFEIKLNPDATDETRIEGQEPPDFDDFTFNQIITQIRETEPVIWTGTKLQGLTSLRDEWLITTTAQDTSGVMVNLTRSFYNNRIPIFQFGVFYDDDVEFHPGPKFDFGGRVHSNANLFLTAGTGLYFKSKVTAHDNIFTDVGKNGVGWSKWGDNVYISDADDVPQKLGHQNGSVLASGGTGGPATGSPLPTTNYNTDWTAYSAKFDNNLLAKQDKLDLPLRINDDPLNPVDYVEMVKRGKAVGDLYNAGGGTELIPNIKPVDAAAADDFILTRERYYNKTGIRVSLADSKAKLPGCADAAGNPIGGDCGVRLDGQADGKPGAVNCATEACGYQPKSMGGGYKATRLNGNRFYQSGREVWIKVETVFWNPGTSSVETNDITEDILSLGVTEPAPVINEGGTTVFEVKIPADYVTKGIDTRSVLKLQRFIFSGAKVTNSNPLIENFISDATWNGINYNFVNPYYEVGPNGFQVDNGKLPAGVADHVLHWKETTVMYPGAPGATKNWVVPFPIEMFDVREGLNYEKEAKYNYKLNIYENKLPRNGVMSMVDIDVGNLKKVIDGVYDGQFPGGLSSVNIPDANGWVLYVSDRRGDYDFDGEYDMEDIYGADPVYGGPDIVRENIANDGILQIGEDINKNGLIDYNQYEAIKYRGDHDISTTTDPELVSPDIAAVWDHKFYRRGVRLINGQTLPGRYDKDVSSNTKGFSVASENGVYVQGNYNATGVANASGPSKHEQYLPYNEPDHVPASVVGDSITILSRNWTDAKSFVNALEIDALSKRKASETTVRFAMIAGDTQSSLKVEPNQGSGDANLSGGVHNFKRFLEDWGGTRLNYSGSLINLFNSHNNNGAFKCCITVYSPPNRNWVFDATFLNPNRLPPGTPFIQSIDFTGFTRTNQ